MANTRIPGTIIRSGSIPTVALSGGVVSSSVQVISALPGDTVSSSAQVTNLLPNGTVSHSAQIVAALPTNTVSHSAQVVAFLPTGTVSSSTQYPGWVTSSTQVDYLQLQNIPTGIASSSAQVTSYLPTGTVSSSGQIDITNTTNYTSFSSSFAAVDTIQTSRLNAIENVTGSYATTGSNTFVAAQTISDTTNSTSYLDGALHVAGGMSVRKDVRVSGSLTVNGLLTAVSMSTQYVTASQYNVGVSKITLNDDDTVRFAGISIYDSGSASPTSASIFWDSLQHRFIYENLSGSAYNSSIIIAGPKHTGSLGDEPTLTSGYVPYATGGDHIDNSVIYQSGSNIGIGVANTSTVGARVKIGTTTRTGKFFDLDAIGGENWIIDSTNTAGSTDVLGIYAYGVTGLYIKDDGNVGIGTNNPSYKLDVRGEAVLGYVSNRYVYIDSNANVIARGESGGWAMAHAFRGSANTDRGGFGVVGADDALTYYWIGADYSNPTMVLTSGSAGNVGINTTSPNRKLVVYGTGDTYASIVGGTSNVASLLFGDTSSDSVGRITYDNSNDSLTFLTDSGNRMFISSAGNVGIGTTNPASKLHVGGNLRLSGSTMWGFEVDESPAFQLIDRTNNQRRMVVNTGGSVYLGGTMSNVQGGGAVMTVSGSGNVGIGTTDPVVKLQVAGRMESVNNNTYGFAHYNTKAANNQYLISLHNETNNSFLLTTGYNGSSVSPTFSLGTTDAARLTISGSNVGIGTTNPGYKLHVNGDIVNTTSVGSTGDAGIQLGNGHRLGFDQAGTRSWTVKATGGNLQFFSGDNSGYHIFSSAGVGIGTTNPTYKVSTQGTGDHRIYHYNSGTTTSDNAIIQAEVAGDNSGNAFFCAGKTGTVWSLGRNTSTGNFEIRSNFNLANDASSRMIIKTDGNVGIGTTNPSAKLQIAGSSYTCVFDADSATFGGRYALLPGRFVVGTVDSGYPQIGYNFTTAAAGALTKIVNDTAWRISFGVNNRMDFGYAGGGTGTFTFTNAMSINTSGNVGIGKTNPQTTLDVYGPIWGTEARFGDDPTNEPYLNIGAFGSTAYLAPVSNMKISYEVGGTGIHEFRTGGAVRMVITAGGNVGIGTTNPGSYKLQVQGDTYVTGTLTEGSSIALKKNINPITDALNIINNLTGYTFDRTDSDATNQAGLIAEEVAEVLPGVVSLDQEGNPSGVQYTKIIAYLVESIKELKSELDELKSR